MISVKRVIRYGITTGDGVEVLTLVRFGEKVIKHGDWPLVFERTTEGFYDTALNEASDV